MTTPTVRVDHLAYVDIEFPKSDRLVAMAFPPKGKELNDLLTTVIALLGLADSIGRILAAERD